MAAKPFLRQRVTSACVKGLKKGLYLDQMSRKGKKQRPHYQVPRH